MTQWMMSTYNQVAGTFYGFAQRHVMTSSYSSYPYTAGWFNRDGNPEDPTILISGAYDGVNRVLYSLCAIDCEWVSVLFSCEWLLLLSMLKSEILLLCFADAARLFLLPVFSNPCGKFSQYSENKNNLKIYKKHRGLGKFYYFILNSHVYHNDLAILHRSRILWRFPWDNQWSRRR